MLVHAELNAGYNGVLFLGVDRGGRLNPPEKKKKIKSLNFVRELPQGREGERTQRGAFPALVCAAGVQLGRNSVSWHWSR